MATFYADFHDVETLTMTGKPREDFNILHMVAKDDRGNSLDLTLFARGPIAMKNECGEVVTEEA